MTQNQIASLSLKLIGIYSIIEAIPLLDGLSQVFAFRGSKISVMENGPFDINLLLIGMLTSFFLLLLVGFVLLICSKALAKKMVTENEITDSLTELSAKNIQSIAFSIVGLIMIKE